MDSAAKKITRARVIPNPKGRYFTLRSIDGSDFRFRLFADGFRVNDEVVILPAPTGEQLALEERVKQLTETADHLRGQVEKLILAQPPQALVEKVTQLEAENGRLRRAAEYVIEKHTEPHPDDSRVTICNVCDIAAAGVEHEKWCSVGQSWLALQVPQ